MVFRLIYCKICHRCRHLVLHIQSVMGNLLLNYCKPALRHFVCFNSKYSMEIQIVRPPMRALSNLDLRHVRSLLISRSSSQKDLDMKMSRFFVKVHLWYPWLHLPQKFYPKILRSKKLQNITLFEIRYCGVLAYYINHSLSF